MRAHSQFIVRYSLITVKVSLDRSGDQNLDDAAVERLPSGRADPLTPVAAAHDLSNIVVREDHQVEGLLAFPGDL